jgi:hypothetical protein
VKIHSTAQVQDWNVLCCSNSYDTFHCPGPGLKRSVLFKLLWYISLPRSRTETFCVVQTVKIHFTAQVQDWNVLCCSNSEDTFHCPGPGLKCSVLFKQWRYISLPRSRTETFCVVQTVKIHFTAQVQDWNVLCCSNSYDTFYCPGPGLKRSVLFKQLWYILLPRSRTETFCVVQTVMIHFLLFYLS